MGNRDYIIGGTLAALAIGSVANEVPILDEGYDGPTGTSLAYCVPVSAKKITKKKTTSAWVHGPAARRAYQFWADGLNPLFNPGQLAVDYLTRFAPVVQAKFNTHPAYFVTEGAQLVDGLAAMCDIHRGWDIDTIYPERHVIRFFNRRTVQYDRLFSTLPLDYLWSKAFYSIHRPPTAHDVKVLNVGAVSSDNIGTEHRVLRSGQFVDKVDFYSLLDYETAVPTHDGRRRIAFAAFHTLPAGETRFFARRHLHTVMDDLGFTGVVEVAVEHFLRGYYPVADSNDAQWQVEHLAKHNIYSVGGAAKARKRTITEDIFEGLSIGGSLL